MTDNSVITDQNPVVYPVKYAQGFGVLSFAVVISSLLVDSGYVFTHIRQECIIELDDMVKWVGIQSQQNRVTLWSGTHVWRCTSGYNWGLLKQISSIPRTLILPGFFFRDYHNARYICWISN